MPRTTEKRLHVAKDIQLKRPPGCQDQPFNKFSIKYTVTTTHIGSEEVKRDEGDSTLVNPKCLGLNPFWLHTRRAPVDQVVGEKKKETLRELHPKFPYWGHLIYSSIKRFNASSTTRCLKLVYDLRHGEADHNAWKTLLKGKNPDPWSKNPEHRKYAIITHGGAEYCLIDPPLTAKGVQQAQDANATFRQLKTHMFPMPKRAYVSPLLRAMQTFDNALGSDPENDPKYPDKETIIQPEDSYILDKLREQETGNSADILIEEYASGSKLPRKPRKIQPDWYEEEDDEKVQMRTASLHDDIFGMDDSDCIVRVTHSLLIKNNLIRLKYLGGNVLQKFMLAEGGLFAYVVEGKRAKKRKAGELGGTTWEKVTKRQENIENSMGPRRRSAFLNLDAPTTPVKVSIEREIKTRHAISMARMATACA